MNGVLLLAGFEFFGCAVAEGLFRDRGRLTRIWLGLSLGLGMMMWFPSLFAFAVGFTVLAQVLGICLALLCAVAAFLLTRSSQKTVQGGEPEEEAPLYLAATLVLPMLLLSGYLQYTHILRNVDGALHVGQSTYGDLCLHLGIATGLQGASYPPTYTLLQDTLLGYPFLADAMAASMLMLGTPLALSFTLTGTVMMGLVYLGFVLLAWEMTRRPAAVALAFVLMFFNGGLGFLYVLDGVWQDDTMLREVFDGFYRTPTNMPDLNLRWVNVICDMMIPQRTLLAGWMMLLPALYLLTLAMRRGERRLWLALGVWAGAMPMVHTHSFLALGLLSFGAGAFLLVRERAQGWKSLLQNLGIYGGIAVLLALPQLLTWTFPQTVGGGSMRFLFNWVNWDPSRNRLIDGYFWFWIKNVGLPYLLLVPAAMAADRRGRAIAWGALAIYATAELFRFQPNTYDNNKLFYVAYMVMTPLLGSYLAGVWDKLRGVRGRALVAALLIVVCTLSAGLTIGRELVSDYQLFSAAEVAAADYVRDNTPRDAVFLTGQQHTNAISSLAGRQIVCGTGSYLYYHGIPYEQQEIDCGSMLSAPAEHLDLFDRYGVDYVYISGQERGRFVVDETYFAEMCPLVYASADVNVYAWSNSARTFASQADAWPAG